jgi:hypothetical protein
MLCFSSEPLVNGHDRNPPTAAHVRFAPLSNVCVGAKMNGVSECR